jgi:hypothetical protein
LMLCPLGCYAANDPQHCGSCSNDCQSGTCLDGQCTCAAGYTNCGPAIGCVDLQNDGQSCGVCGQVCGGGACVAGICQCPQQGQVWCVGVGCTDLSGDPHNCGACGHSCGASPGTQCTFGQCG